MAIRKARREDWRAIGKLLDQLEYPGWEGFLERRVGQLIGDADENLLVWEEEGGGIAAFVSLHFIPQLALAGDFARISYFAVDGDTRSQGIGRQMEEYCEVLARERGCALMEVHCHTRRVRAHAFYYRQGFEESPKYLLKRLQY